MSAKVSQGTNIVLPSRILALNVVLYAVKAFKNEIKHMNAKEPRACARFFNATITRALIHNNTMYPSEASWSEIKSLMPQSSSSSSCPGQHGGARGGALSLADAWSRSEAPVCARARVFLPLCRGSWRGQEGLTCEKLNSVQNGSWEPQQRCQRETRMFTRATVCVWTHYYTSLSQIKRKT